MDTFKNIIKFLLRFIPIHFTKNMEYDAQTKLILKKVCKHTSNCIDIGCHKGEIMDLFCNMHRAERILALNPYPRYIAI